MSQKQLLLSRARSATLSRDFELAARLYRQLLRDDRNNVSILTELGNLYIKSEQDELALPVFKRIAELDKKNFDVYITLGGIYRRLKRYDDSVAVLEQSLLINGDNPQVLYNLGFTYKIMGDTENAISFFEDTIEKNPDDVLAYNHIGTIYAQKNDHEKAIQSYLRGLNVDANHPVLLMNLAKSYEALGDYKKACEAYSHALRSRPFWTDAITDYSHLLVKLNRVNDAKTLVTRACSANPRDERLKACLDYVEQFVVINADNTCEQNLPAAGEEKAEIEEAEEVQPTAQESETEEVLQPEVEVEEEENIEEEPEEEVEEEADLEDLKQENEEDFDFDAFGQDEGEEELLAEEEPEESLEEPLAEDEELSQEPEEAENNAAGNGTESETAEDELESSEETQNTETEGDEESEEKDEEEGTAAGGESCNGDDANLEVAEAEDEPSLLEIEAEDFNPFDGLCPDTSGEPCEVEEIADDESQIELLADAENMDPKLSLFIKLRQLLKYLPEEKLLEYQSSEARLMLDYLVLHLSGHKGLLQTAFELKDSENKGQIEENLQEEADNTGSLNTELFENGIKVVKDLVQKLPDKNLVYAMEQQLKKLEQ